MRFQSILLLAFVQAVCASLAANSPGTGQYDSYLAVKVYRLRLSWTANQHKNATNTTGDCYQKESSQASFGATASLRLVRDDHSATGDFADWRIPDGEAPEGQCSYSVVYERREKCKDSGEPESLYRMKQTGGGLGEGGGRLTINTATGQYRMTGFVTTAQGSLQQQSSTGPSWQTPVGLTLLAGPGNGPPQEITGALQPGGRSLKGEPIAASLTLFQRLQSELTWSIEPWEDEDPPEVSVEPEPGYDQWLPKADLDSPSHPGNNLLIHIKVHKKGDPSTPRKANLWIALASVSNNKGLCMNWPVDAQEGKHGLRFRKEDFAGEGPLKFVDESHLESTKSLEQAEFLVHAYDFGAWGSLQIKAKDGNERDLKVRVRGQDKADLAVPLDENHNHIADAWEQKWVGDLHGSGGDDDEGQPEGKAGCSGDGLSLYEEYRGFRIQGGHVRTDPKQKDVFICDHTARQIAQGGIDLFETVTQLQVRRIAFEELDSDRVVNGNGGADTGHGVDQHGILIVDGNSDPEAVAATEDGRFGPPVLTEHVQLPKGRSFTTEDDRADVAHELCHAVGVAHHGHEGNLVPVEWFWKVDAAGTWQLYEQAIENNSSPGWLPTGEALLIRAFYEPAEGAPTKPFTHGSGPPNGSLTVGVDRWRLHLGKKDSPLSGDQECLIRYPDKQAYVADSDPAGTRYLPDKAQWKPRTRLCESKEGTGVNAKGHRPQSRYGPASLGACKTQVVVNDKYARK